MKIHKLKKYLLCDIFYIASRLKECENWKPVSKKRWSLTIILLQLLLQLIPRLNPPGPSHVVDSSKRERMRILEGDDEEEKRDGPSKKPKKTPIINLIRDNHMKYNKFI